MNQPLPFTPTNQELVDLEKQTKLIEDKKTEKQRLRLEKQKEREKKLKQKEKSQMITLGLLVLTILIALVLRIFNWTQIHVAQFSLSETATDQCRLCSLLKSIGLGGESGRKIKWNNGATRFSSRSWLQQVVS